MSSPIVVVRSEMKEGVPIYRQIADQIKFLVASGRLHAGEQLPPVRKLAEQLVVNPNTVARAYRELEVVGLVTARQGSGAFVSGNGSPLAWKEKSKRLTERIGVWAGLDPVVLCRVAFRHVLGTSGSRCGACDNACPHAPGDSAPACAHRSWLIADHVSAGYTFFCGDQPVPREHMAPRTLWQTDSS